MVVGVTSGGAAGSCGCSKTIGGTSVIRGGPRLLMRVRDGNDGFPAGPGGPFVFACTCTLPFSSFTKPLIISWISELVLRSLGLALGKCGDESGWWVAFGADFANVTGSASDLARDEARSPSPERVPRKGASDLVMSSSVKSISLLLVGLICW